MGIIDILTIVFLATAAILLVPGLGTSKRRYHEMSVPKYGFQPFLYNYFLKQKALSSAAFIFLVTAFSMQAASAAGHHGRVLHGDLVALSRFSFGESD